MTDRSMHQRRMQRMIRAFLACLFILCFHQIGDIRSSAQEAASESPTSQTRQRRILYNLDGDSCLTTRHGGNGVVAIEKEDLDRLVDEISFEGSQVDTLLVCINAQVMYYPTDVGTMRGMRSSQEEREKWSAREKQRFETIEKFIAAGIDPYQYLLSRAKAKGLEALITFRMNDDHGDDFLRTEFFEKNPECRLSRGALNFAKQEVRNYTRSLIREAIERYDCDGIELDFNRFPNFFAPNETGDKIAWMNEIVAGVSADLKEVAAKRKRDLLLAIRVPSNFGRTRPTLDSAKQLGCDVEHWTKQGWIDFVTVSEFLFQPEHLPLDSWAPLKKFVPVYGGIECTTAGAPEFYLDAKGYRKAARQLWDDGASGVYLFNFFTTREYDQTAWDPPFEVLEQLGSAEKLIDFEQKSSGLYLAYPLTYPGSFTGGVEGPGVDVAGNLFAVNYADQQTIGKIEANGRTRFWLRLPMKSTGNGIRFDKSGTMYIADYVEHQVLAVDKDSRDVVVFAKNDAMNQPNDLAIMSDGTLFASDPNWGASTGQIWRIDHDGSTTKVAEQMGTTNGIDVSPDGKRLYVNESEQRKIWEFEINADKSLANKRLFAEFPDFGFDGMRFDIDGNLYVTRHGKGCVAVLNSEGKVIREIDVLGKHPTNLAFGGPDGCTVYVTEAEKKRVVAFRVEKPGLEWQQLRQK